MTLTEVLEDPVKKAALVRDGALLVEEEVKAKRGLSGMALKAGFKTIQKIRPGIISQVLSGLLPEFAVGLEGHLTTAQSQGDVPTYFTTHSTQIAESLLGVTDKRAEKTDSRVMRRVYRGLRGSALGQVKEAAPGLGRLFAKHVK